LVKVENLPKTTERFNEEFNRKAIDNFNQDRVANMIMLGFIIKKNIISCMSLKKAINDLISPKIQELNENALDWGLDWVMDLKTNKVKINIWS